MTDAAKSKNAELLRNYKATFGSPAGQAVLIDLAPFCRAAETCVVIPAAKGPIDRERTLIAEGRREVWLRIQKFLQLDYDDLFTLYRGHPINAGEDDD